MDKSNAMPYIRESYGDKEDVLFNSMLHCGHCAQCQLAQCSFLVKDFQVGSAELYIILQFEIFVHPISTKLSGEYDT